MPTFTRPAQLMKATQDRVKRLKLTMGDVHKVLYRGGVQDASSLTRGTVSTATLRREGHPFGRLGGQGSATGGRGLKPGARGRLSSTGRKGQINKKGVLAPLPINKQTGRLRSSLSVKMTGSGDEAVQVGFDAPYAQWVLSPRGTKKMVARGYFQEIVTRHKARKAGAIAAFRSKNFSQ